MSKRITAFWAKAAAIALVAGGATFVQSSPAEAQSGPGWRAGPSGRVVVGRPGVRPGAMVARPGVRPGVIRPGVVRPGPRFVGRPYHGPRGYGYYGPNGAWLGAAAAALVIGGTAAAIAAQRPRECWIENRWVERWDGAMIRQRVRVCD